MTASMHVTLDVRRARTRDVPALLASGARAVRQARRDPQVLLAKLLATTGGHFRPTDLRPTRWAVLTCRLDGETVDTWEPRGEESATLHLQPLWSRGSWDGHRLPVTRDAAWDGRVVMLTRATLRLTRVRAFYAAVPAIAAEVRAAAGLRAGFGIGESPALRQGTVSVWESGADLGLFGGSARAHADAVRSTPRTGWYAEELFVRLALVHASGSIDGVSMAP
jgi:hypothetical protein